MTITVITDKTSKTRLIEGLCKEYGISIESLLNCTDANELSEKEWSMISWDYMPLTNNNTMNEAFHEIKDLLL